MREAVKAHGLDGTLVEPDWPPLSPDEVRRLLTRYPGLRPPFEVLSVSPRPLSAASVVATSDRCVFVKRHARAVRDAEGVREEHRFMAYLLAQGICVPQVLADENGGTAVEADGGTYEVHTIPPGIDAYEDAISWTPFRSVMHAQSAGQMMARLHRAARGYDAPRRTMRPLVAGFTIFAATDPEAEFNRYVSSRPALSHYLDRSGCASEALELLAPFHAELAPLLNALDPLWTHNDLHPSNLFWSDAGSLALATAAIDFGLCDRTNTVHDLAHALERSIVEWLVLINNPRPLENVPVHMDHLWAFLEGYESELCLTAEEAAALVPMLALCHAEFALSEADYFLTALDSPERAHIACEGYLVSHARWWRGPGTGILDGVRDWAHGARTRQKVTAE